MQKSASIQPRTSPAKRVVRSFVHPQIGMRKTYNRALNYRPVHVSSCIIGLQTPIPFNEAANPFRDRVRHVCAPLCRFFELLLRAANPVCCIARSRAVASHLLFSVLGFVPAQPVSNILFSIFITTDHSQTLIDHIHMIRDRNCV